MAKRSLWVLALALAATGCNDIFGMVPGELDPGTTTGTGGTTTGTGTDTGATTSAGGTTTGTGGTTSTETACDGCLLWSRTYGDGEEQYLRGITTDPEGNVLLTGIFGDQQAVSNSQFSFGGLDLSSTSWDVFVAKLDPNGEHLWSRGFGDANPVQVDGAQQVGVSIAADTQGNFLVTGYFQGSIKLGDALDSQHTSAGSNDVFVAKYSPAGTHVVSKRFGDGNDQMPRGIATDAEGNVYITGMFQGTVDFGGLQLTSATGWDAFVVKLSPLLETQWAKSLGGPGGQYGLSLAVSADTVIVQGTFTGSIDSIPCLSGAAPSTNANDDVFVFSLTKAGGACTWVKQYGDMAGQCGEGVTCSSGVATDGDGNIVLAGYYGGTIDFSGGNGGLVAGTGTSIYVAKLQANGTHVWSHTFGDEATGQYAYKVAVDGAGDVLLTGTFGGSVNFADPASPDASMYELKSVNGSDIFVAKLDGATGYRIWSHNYADAGKANAGYAIAADEQGNVLAGGDFAGLGATIDFGDGPHDHKGQGDVFVVKFAP